MIFTEENIEKNKLYAPVMEKINEIHDLADEPEPPDSGPTTGGLINSVWEADGIGVDWGGKEYLIAEKAHGLYLDVANALNLGDYPYYYSSDEWLDFANKAGELLAEFQNYDAFQRLCNEVSVSDILLSDL